MPSKRFHLPLPRRADIESHGPRHWHSRWPIWQMKVRSNVVQPLRPKWSFQLSIPLHLPRPMKRSGRQHRNHHVIRVRIRSAVSAKRHHDIRLVPSYPFHQSSRSHREVDELQLSILIVHQLVVRHPQHLAGRRKLISPHLPQRISTRCIATIGRRLPIRQANHISINPTIRSQSQRSTKCITLIIRVRHHAHQLQAHSAFSISTSSNSNSADTTWSNAASGSTARTGAKLLRCSAQGPISASARRCSGVP